MENQRKTVEGFEPYGHIVKKLMMSRKGNPPRIGGLLPSLLETSWMHVQNAHHPLTHLESAPLRFGKESSLGSDR